MVSLACARKRIICEVAAFPAVVYSVVPAIGNGCPHVVPAFLECGEHRRYGFFLLVSLAARQSKTQQRQQQRSQIGPILGRSSGLVDRLGRIAPERELDSAGSSRPAEGGHHLIGSRLPSVPGVGYYEVMLVQFGA
jgi:hypothetical protein